MTDRKQEQEYRPRAARQDVVRHIEVRRFLGGMPLFRPDQDLPGSFDDLLARLDVAEALARKN